jgi:hypothetical protein
VASRRNDGGVTKVSSLIKLAIVVFNEGHNSLMHIAINNNQLCVSFARGKADI